MAANSLVAADQLAEQDLVGNWTSLEALL